MQGNLEIEIENKSLLEIVIMNYETIGRKDTHTRKDMEEEETHIMGEEITIIDKQTNMRIDIDPDLKIRDLERNRDVPIQVWNKEKDISTNAIIAIRKVI